MLEYEGSPPSLSPSFSRHNASSVMVGTSFVPQDVLSAVVMVEVVSAVTMCSDCQCCDDGRVYCSAVTGSHPRAVW